MTRTHFVNPNGLPADAQVTTARDLAKLSRVVVREFPEYAEFWATPSFRLGKVRLTSFNSLLRTFKGANGLKTGFICDSGFNVVASAERDGRSLMAVVLGEPSGNDRSIRAASLLEHGFQNYDWKAFFNPETVDNRPLDRNAQPVHSIRHTITSYSCGNRRTARKLYQMRKRAKEQRAARLDLKPLRILAPGSFESAPPLPLRNQAKP